MASFKTLEEYQKAIAAIKSTGLQVPQLFLDEMAILEAEQNIKEDEYIFGTMAAHNKFMTPEKEKVVREMTDQLLMEGENATQPCLLLGKVQCGKTDTFLSIMGLCFDRGIDIAVVMTKGTNTLTKQTIQRLNQDFRFFKDDGTYNQKVVISVWDILDLYKRGGLSDYQLNKPTNKFIIVCKKENTNLKNLIDLFEKNELLRSKRVLVCDDEADFASRAYYQRKNELSLLRIAEHIETFIKLPTYCRYLQITATPYSLYLQPDGTVQLREGQEASPWLPRYTGLVPIHDKYIGGKQYYVDSQEGEVDEEGNFVPANMYGCLFQPVDPIAIDILSARNEWYLESKAHSGNLDSLSFAVVSYLFAAAIRTIQKRKSSNEKYYSSCLIHCEIAKKNHSWQEELITNIIEDIKHAFLTKGNADLHILDMESDAYQSFKTSNELANAQGLINESFPSFAEVEAEVKRILEYNDYTINVVNSEEPGKVATMLNEKGQLHLEQALNFFIGGSILDRGITIDNMLCFFYGRDPKKFQMDTVLQHSRMYGARDKEDMACTRFFTTEAIYDVLKTMNEFDEYLYDYLKSHRGSLQTDDFTSIVIGYDKRIKPSAQNKYTPANTKVLKPKQRILPIGFQTGDEVEIGKTIKKIDKLIEEAPGYSEITEKEPFFMMSYERAVELINLITSTLRYGEEYENMDYEWDKNEMLTALDHCTFDTDGMIYCLHRTDRNMSRERQENRLNKTRWIDSPDDGRSDLKPSRQVAQERPVLMLLRQNGSEEQGWSGTPFYWPVLLMPENLRSGIFTINDKRKMRKQKKQIKLDTISNYPVEEVLQLTIRKEEFFAILAGVKVEELREIKTTTASLYLEKDESGEYKLAPGTNPHEYYSVNSVNDGLFPFVLKECKYLYLRSSRDNNGTQALIRLDERHPFDLKVEAFVERDVIFDSAGQGSDIQDDRMGIWTIFFNLNEILEVKFTKQDESDFNDFIAELEIGSKNE